MTYVPTNVDPGVHIHARADQPPDPRLGELWYDEGAAQWKVCTAVGPPPTWAIWAPPSAGGCGGPAQYVELLDHLPAIETGRILYLTQTVGAGYEADRLYVGLPG